MPDPLIWLHAACTKGLWIWTEAIPSQREDGKPVNILVIDTEGIGALSADHTHDTRIFTLALLLSSLFVYVNPWTRVHVCCFALTGAFSYNSTGAIDEAALSSLGLIVNLTKHIQVRSGTKGEDDGSDFATFFPEFLWILRDFALMLKDANGRSMSSKECALCLLRRTALTLADPAAGTSRRVLPHKRARAKPLSKRTAFDDSCPDFSRRGIASRWCAQWRTSRCCRRWTPLPWSSCGLSLQLPCEPFVLASLVRHP
jgi:hypothetical protein